MINLKAFGMLSSQQREGSNDMASVQDFVKNCPLCGTSRGLDRCESEFEGSWGMVWFGCQCGASATEGLLFTDGRPPFEIRQRIYTSSGLANNAWVDAPEEAVGGHSFRRVTVFQPVDLRSRSGFCWERRSATRTARSTGQRCPS